MTTAEEFKARARARDRLKKQRKRKRQKAAEAQARLARIAAAGHSKTSAVYRRRLAPLLPETAAKSELRALLAQAVRNTAGAGA